MLLVLLLHYSTSWTSQGRFHGLSLDKVGNLRVFPSCNTLIPSKRVKLSYLQRDNTFLTLLGLNLEFEYRAAFAAGQAILVLNPSTATASRNHSPEGRSDL